MCASSARRRSSASRMARRLLSSSRMRSLDSGDVDVVPRDALHGLVRQPGPAQRGALLLHPRTLLVELPELLAQLGQLGVDLGDRLGAGEPDHVGGVVAAVTAAGAPPGLPGL